MEHVNSGGTAHASVYSDDDEDAKEYVSISLVNDNTQQQQQHDREDEMAEAPITVVHRMMRWGTSPSLPPSLVALLQHPRASWHLLVALFVSLALLVLLMSMRG
jgi:hypothetical protein